MDNLFEYRKAMDGLRFTPEQKEALTHTVAAQAAGEPRATRRPLRRMVLVTAAAVLVLAVGTASATGLLKSAAEVFAPLLGGQPAQTEIVDKIGRPLGAAANGHGLTITADAILGDSRSACIVYSVARTDGAPLGLPAGVEVADLLFEESDCDLRGGNGNNGSAWFTDDNPADSTVQFVTTTTAEDSLKLGAVQTTFRDLCYWDEAKSANVPLFEGKWVIRFDADYEDSSVAVPAGQTFGQDGVQFTITEIRLSPVAIQVEYEAGRQVVWSDSKGAEADGRVEEHDAQEVARYLHNVKILLTKTDGTVLDLTNSGGNMRPENGKTICGKGGVFEEILPLEQVESITVGGVVIPLP